MSSGRERFVRVELENGQAAFQPGDEVRGSLYWSLDGTSQDPGRESIEVRLFWRTEGKGTGDAEIAQVEKIEAAGPQGERSFRLLLPQAPWSFSGKLISLVWAVEAVAEASGESGRVDIVSAPGGREVRITAAGGGHGDSETASGGKS